MAWYDSNWGYRKQIDLAASAFGTDLTDFPAFIDLNDDDDLETNAKGDGTDILFTADDEVTKLDHQLGEFNKVLKKEAHWFFQSSPEAVYDASSNKTFFGYVNSFDGDHVIASYDHDTGAVVTNELLDNSPNPDGHANPAVILRDDGHIVVFYGRHADTSMYSWISTSPGDISTGTTYDISSTTSAGNPTSYPQAYQFDNGDIALVMRRNVASEGEERNRRIAISSDGGQSFASGTDFLEGPTDQRPYMQICGVGNNLHILAGYAHPREITQGEGDIGHAIYDATTDSWTDATGNALTLPFTIREATLIEDASTRGYNFWDQDFVDGGDGNLYAVYTEHRNITSNGTTQPHDVRTRYAIFDLTAETWSTNEVTGVDSYPLAAEEDIDTYPHYPTGAVVDPQSPDTVYACHYNGRGEMVMSKCVTADSGATWSNEEVRKAAFRPVIPQNAHSDLQVLYLSGSYANWENAFENDICFIGDATPHGLVCNARVKIPSVTAASGATIFMYYGNASASAQENPSGVDDADTLDVRQGEAKVGFYSGFDFNGLTGFTLEAYYRYLDVNASQVQFSDTDTSMLFSSDNSGTSELLLRENQGDLELQLVDGGGVNQTQTYTGVDLLGTERKSVAIVWDGAEVRALVQGQEATQTLSISTLQTGSADMWIGFDINNTLDILWGKLQLARISQVARSNDYLKATDALYRTPGTTLTFGVQETEAGVPTVTVTKDGAAASGVVVVTIDTVTLAVNDSATTDGSGNATVSNDGVTVPLLVEGSSGFSDLAGDL